MPAKPLFIGGTGSHVGKSWVAAALCRYLFRMGYRVAPFKAQNMSNNSMVCADGGEIGRAQAAQAQACGLAPTTDMNPILLKPSGEMRSQVVVHGRPWRNLEAREYYAHFDYLLERVMDSYRRLASACDYVVIEGAGSVTELNLKDRDLVNLGLARRLNAASILVADIDRGGVFASVVGTFHLLEPEEAALVRTFLVNRFRGDISLFDNGRRILEEKTARPCLGVFPFEAEIYLDAEDSVSLQEPVPKPAASGVRAAIVRLPHISNFTDFRLLPDAVYLSAPAAGRFDAVFLPGTKNTIDDMHWLREKGFEPWLREQLRGGAKVIGVCGGFQMLGDEIRDPDHVESERAFARGLGLVHASTTLDRVKTTRLVSGRTGQGHSFTAYEIHMGVTSFAEPPEPFAILDDGSPEGIRIGGVVGTYCHGAFEERAVLEEVLGVPLAAVGGREASYDRLADWLAAGADLSVLHGLF